MLMHKLPIIRLNECNRPSTSSPQEYSSSWLDDAQSVSTMITSLGDSCSMASCSSRTKLLPKNPMRVPYYHYNGGFVDDSSCGESSTSATNTTTSSEDGSLISAKITITQQGYYSPFESPKPVNDRVIAPNACPEPMACLASTSSAAMAAGMSPTRGSFFDRIRDVFRPRSGSKSSTTSDNSQQYHQQPIGLNGEIVEDLGVEWIHILYYEHSEKVGKTFKSTASEIAVTGFSDLSSNYRLNLGSVANSHRTPMIRHVRSLIRDGVKFYNRNGDVYVDCLAAQPVFIQAPCFSKALNKHLATVYKLPPGQSMMVFSAAQFDHLIFEAQRLGPDAINRLQQICHLRISFSRGWGEDYQTQTVLELPAWIEVLFDGALHELDQLLAEATAAARKAAANNNSAIINDLSCSSMSLS